MNESIYDAKFNGKAVIKNEDITGIDPVLLINCEALEEVDLDGSDLNNLTIKNCKKLRKVWLKNCKIDFLLLISLNHELEISISRGVIRKCELFGKFKVVEFKSTSIIEHVFLTKVNIVSLAFNSTNEKENIIEYLHIKNSSLFCSVQIINQNIRTFNLDSSTIKYLSIKSCELKSLHFELLKLNNFCKSSSLDKGDYYETEIELVNTNIKETTKIIFSNNNINSTDFNFYLDNINFGKRSEIQLPESHIQTILNVGYIHSSEGLYINHNLKNGRNSKELIKQKHIGESNLKIFIVYTSSCEGLLIIESLQTKILKVEGTNLKLSTSINSCNVDTLNFNNFDNKGIFKVTNSGIIKTISIKNSDLNDVIFRPIRYEQIKITDDSFIGGMKIYGSDPISLENTYLSREERQEFYRQLKQAAKNSNNRFLELEYKAREMEYYLPSQNTDKIIHWFNSINSYGLDWGWPVVIMVLCNFLLWIPFTALLYPNYFGELDFSYLGYTMGKMFDEYSFSYFHLLNPISKMSDFAGLKEYPNDIHWMVHFIFITSKVLNSVFIYQIVTAFRKWVGKE